MNLLLLKKDGRVIAKDERNLTPSDIDNSERILVNANASDHDRLFEFVSINPSLLLLFTRAIIEYQMGLIFDDMDDSIDVQYSDPVRIETDKITTLICLINSVDKINVANNFLIEEYSDMITRVGVTFIRVCLYSGNNVIYDEHYDFSNKSNVNYDTYKIAKKFNAIYDPDVKRPSVWNDEYLSFYYKKKNLYWEKNSIDGEYDLLGLPTIMSNMMLLCTDEDIANLRSYRSLDMQYVIYFSNENKIAEITQFIKLGKEFEFIQEKIEETEDYMIDAHKLIRIYTKRLSVPIDMVLNAPFAFRVIQMLYEKAYDSHELTYQFDCVICLSMTKKDDINHQKELVMNTRTLVDPIEFLAEL